MILYSSYLHSGISYTAKMTSYIELEPWAPIQFKDVVLPVWEIPLWQ